MSMYRNLNKNSNLGNTLLITFAIMLTVVMCENKKNENSEKGRGSVVNATTTKKSLNGIWGNTNSENASFEIAGDSIYYLDADKKMYYTLSDSIMIVYEENGNVSFKSKVIHMSGDSLIMLSEGGVDTLTFKKFK